MRKMKDKYYYFPTQTKNIMFIKGEQYICLSNICCKLMNKYDEYICESFTVGNVYKPIIFRDSLGSLYRVSPWDCGSFLSISKYRKMKLKRLNEKIEK